MKLLQALSPVLYTTRNRRIVLTFNHTNYLPNLDI